MRRPSLSFGFNQHPVDVIIQVVDVFLLDIGEINGDIESVLSRDGLGAHDNALTRDPFSGGPVVLFDGQKQMDFELGHGLKLLIHAAIDSIGAEIFGLGHHIKISTGDFDRDIILQTRPSASLGREINHGLSFGGFLGFLSGAVLFLTGAPAILIAIILAVAVIAFHPFQGFAAGGARFDLRCLRRRLAFRSRLFLC